MSLMCLFPWLDYGIDIVDFEKFDFLVGQPIFTSVRGSPVGQNGLSRNQRISLVRPPLRQNFQILKGGGLTRLGSFCVNPLGRF